jgi:predicted ester cyclase
VAAAFPDMQSSEDDLIADGEAVVVRRTMRGTHQGEFHGDRLDGQGRDVYWDLARPPE